MVFCSVAKADVPTSSIKNPLAHLSSEAVIQDAKLFAEIHGLTHITPMLVKGALVAKDPTLFEQVPGITEDEKQCIRNEILHKWRQSRALYFTVGLTCIGAAVQLASHLYRTGTRFKAYKML